MSKFQVGSGGRIYDPIVVEIDGKSYTARKLTRDLIRELDGIKPGDADSSWSVIDLVYQQLNIMLGPEAKTDVDNLDIREASDLLIFITNQYAQKVDKPAVTVQVGGEAQGDQGKN